MDFVSYLRVSTQHQGAQGLGIEAQRAMCADYIEKKGGTLIHEFMDVESGTHRNRKGLWSAIEYCQRSGCSLVIAKLDRLARDVEFTFKVINTGIDIHFTDMPVVNSMILGVFASVAQYERELISTRTKQALNAKRERGEKLGGANDAWKDSYYSNSDDERRKIVQKRGETKRRRHLCSRDVVTFGKVVRTIFPDACKGDDMSQWNWRCVNTKGDHKTRIFMLMKDYKDVDNTLFKSWDFSDMSNSKLQTKLASYIATLRSSFATSNIN